MYRKTARAFAGDAKGLETARLALARSHPAAFNLTMRLFFYLPFQHSEALSDQDLGCALFAAFEDAETMRHAVEHRDVIVRFGRFPHRNDALGRACTPDELDYLKTGNRSDSDLAIESRRCGVEAAEDHALEAVRMGLHLAHGDLGRRFLGIAVDAGRDRWEGDAFQAVLPGQRQAVAIAARQQLRFARCAAVPDRADGMDDVARFQAIAPGDLGLAGLAAVECAAFGQ